jgi:uncharacterized membrane protein
LKKGDPEQMNEAIGKVLRTGVVASAAIIAVGAFLLLSKNAQLDVSGYLTYDPSHVPHGAFPVSLSALFQGLADLDPFAMIELGVVVLLATPVSRVLASVLLFAAQGDRTYFYITLGVLSLLLFSMLATPFIPGFNA